MLPIHQPPISTNYLLCHLCRKSALLPRLCPKCFKCYCNHCLIAASSLHPDCPKCGHKIKLQECLQPQLVLGIVEQVAEAVRRQYRGREERQQCPEHELPLNYYCMECKGALCGDCGLLTKHHAAHKILAYRDIYQRTKAKVLEEFPRFDRKLVLLQARKHRLKQALQSLQQQYRLYKKRFEEEFLQYSDKVQRETNEQQVAITAMEESNNRRLQELEVLRDSIYEEMETKTQISLIEQAPSLVESIEALTCQEPIPARIQACSELQELKDLMPEYTVWTYALTEFSSRNGIVYSNQKSLNGVEWRLKIYPRGNGLARDRYISVFVEMTKGLVSQNRYEYRIELLNLVHPQWSVRREYCSTFEMGECWGYNQFEPLEELAAKQYIHEDTLHFRIAVRNRNYYSLAQQQQLYLNHLTTQLAQQKTSGSSAEDPPLSDPTRPVARSGNLEKRIKQFLLKQSRRGSE